MKYTILFVSVESIKCLHSLLLSQPHRRHGNELYLPVPGGDGAGEPPGDQGQAEHLGWD